MAPLPSLKTELIATTRGALEAACGPYGVSLSGFISHEGVEYKCHCFIGVRKDGTKSYMPTGVEFLILNGENMSDCTVAPLEVANALDDFIINEVMPSITISTPENRVWAEYVVKAMQIYDWEHELKKLNKELGEIYDRYLQAKAAAKGVAKV